jgi:hypothetical protein
MAWHWHAWQTALVHVQLLHTYAAAYGGVAFNKVWAAPLERLQPSCDRYIDDQRVMMLII